MENDLPNPPIKDPEEILEQMFVNFISSVSQDIILYGESYFPLGSKDERVE